MKKNTVRFIIFIAFILCCLSAAVQADDTDIYGVQNISVQPNVLIIFDNSGSMAETVAGEYYSSTKTYSGSYSTNAVYYVYNKQYKLITSNVSNITCSGVSNLKKNGTAKMKINTSSLNCKGNSITLYMGNYINYDQSGLSPRPKIDVAKEVITDLVNNTDNVRFGLMKFKMNSTDTDNGGTVVASIGSDKTTITNAIAALTASTWTPLAETMAEAGLYYAGKSSWYNSGTYTSPIQYECQKNYIILMTDGEPTQDYNHKLYDTAYINGDKIGDYDKDGRDPGYANYESNGSDYLDDVAKYLYVNDLRSDLGAAGSTFERQNVITYTIGFQTDQDLLSRTAANGGGQYYTAYSASGLQNAFQEIISSISDVNSVFVAPVVPVSKLNRTYSGDKLYLGFFKPQQDGRWVGNIKKYGLNANGNIIDANGVIATLSDGTIIDNATSYWSDSPDGPNVTSGGVGGVLADQASRNVYTYKGTQSSLKDASNAFSVSNAALTVTDLSVTDSTARSAVINDIIGTTQDWLLGDILHSQPLVVPYDTDSYIFAGSNDGMMHAFKDSTGEEIWGFIPPDQLSELKNLSDSNTTHDYFMDGSPVLYSDSSQKILFFGERRGGFTYYALTITDPASPYYRYKIASNILGSSAPLGQSWSAPTVATIKTSSTASTPVFLMAGGYDDANQDLGYDTTVYPGHPAAADTKGRAVFAVNVSNGAVTGLNVNAGNKTDMTNCIVDVSGFDSNGDGYVNRVYAGDLGGKMFAFEDDNGDGTWSSRTLFSAPADGLIKRKIFYAPDATKETFGDMIFFGTGDREHPEDTTVVNRIYAVKNTWDSPAPATLTESDLTDVTADLIDLGTAAQKASTQAALDSSKGWFIRLENSGEKVTSSITVFGGVVYVTTYTPEAGAVSSSNPCAIASGRGQSRFYALNYKTGAAAFDYSSVQEKDADNKVVTLGKLDRSKVIGTSIASSPFIAILPGGVTKIYVGTEGGVITESPLATTDLKIFFWRQILQ